MKILTSLISFCSLASWTDHPFMSIMLNVDGLIYNLVSYAFKLFMLMCQLDFSSLYGIVSPLVDRLQAVILVLVVFKLAILMIKWMIEPENAPKEGSKLAINIFVTAMFLIGYNFVFDVFNEVGMLIMGTPEGRDFVVLKQIANITNDGDDSEGLIMRFIFGNESKVEDIGDYLAFETVKIFVHDIDDPDNSPTVSKTICSSEKCDFGNLNEVAIYLDKTVEYIWGISGLVGIFLIYSIVKMAIELGVRMFKLLILQIIAPIAIVTIIDGGIKSSTFQTFYKKYLSVYIEAFTRMITMLITTVFVCRFFINKDSFFNSIGDTGATGVTGMLLTILVVVSAYKIAGSIPKFLDEALGTKMSSGDKKGGFGKFVTGLVGGAMGFAGGIGTGITARAGLGGTLMNAASGAFKGYGAGSKGNNIADFFKNTSENSKANRERALNIARMGGGVEYALHGMDNALGITQKNQSRAQRQSDTIKALENMISARSNALKDEVGNYGIKFGASADEYANKALEYDSSVTSAKLAYESLRGDFDFSEYVYTGDEETAPAGMYKRGDNETDAEFRARIRNDKYNQYIQARDASITKSKSEYNKALFTNKNVEKNASVIEATANYDRRAAKDHSSSDIAKSSDVGDSIKNARKLYAARESKYNNRTSVQRENRPGNYK